MDDVSPIHCINAGGIALIKQFEIFPSLLIWTLTRFLTIGYGCARNVTPGMRITLDQADQFLDEDLQTAESAVQRFVSVPLNDNQFSALVSVTFNVGSGNFEKSTLLTLLDQDFYEQIRPQLMRWNISGGEVLGGLSRRRAAEGALWNTPVTLVASGLPVSESQT
jgi:lysozyme